MKYVTASWIASVLISAVLWMLVSVHAAAVFVIVSMLSIQFCMHTYWTYSNIVDNDDIDTNHPVAGAVIVMLVMYIVYAAAAIIMLIFAGFVASHTAIPFIAAYLLPPAAYFLYRYVQ